MIETHAHALCDRIPRGGVVVTSASPTCERCQEVLDAQRRDEATSRAVWRVVTLAVMGLALLAAVALWQQDRARAHGAARVQAPQ